MFGVVRADKGSDSWILKGVTGAYWKNALKRIYEHAVTKYISPQLYGSLENILGEAGYVYEQQQHELSRRQQQIQQNQEIKLFITSWI